MSLAIIVRKCVYLVATITALISMHALSKCTSPTGAHPGKTRHLDKYADIFRCYGGANDVASNGESTSPTIAADNSGEVGQGDGNCAVLVSTSIGSSFLDKKKRLLISRNSTVYNLKQVIKDKYPGGPPVELQKLFFGSRKLNDSEVLSNITKISPIPVLLDMLTGTSAYNRTLSVSQALEAYASIVTQQAYIGDKLRAAYTDQADESTGRNHDVIDSLVYKEMFQSINESIYRTYTEEIQAALIAEMEPEVVSSDTERWRGDKKQKSPLAVALAKEFDFNARSLKSFVYYSIVIAVNRNHMKYDFFRTFLY